MVFIDRPVALFFNEHRELRRLFQLCATPSLLSLPLAALYLIWSVLWRLTGRRLPGRNDVLLAMSLATLAGTTAKDELKWIIGRPWPDAWLHAGLYRPSPFARGEAYGSFPSGHTAYIAAPMFALAIMLPRYRLPAFAIICAVMVGLVGADYHFVGDVVAGLFTGLAAAAGTVVMMRKAQDKPWDNPPENVQSLLDVKQTYSESRH